MKSIIQNYTPQECERIARGEQTIKICKTAPKEAPFRVYMYCTKKGRPLVYAETSPYCTDATLHRTYGMNKEDADKTFGAWNGKVVGEYICNRVDNVEYKGGKFMINNDVAYTNKVASRSCIDYDDMLKKVGTGGGKAMHIADIKIYDEPKRLGEFRKPFSSMQNVLSYDQDVGHNVSVCDGCDYAVWKEKQLIECKNDGCVYANLWNAPKSWQYVEELQ